MNTVILDITKKRTKEEIESFLKEENLKEGDTLKIMRNDDTSDIELFGTLFLIIGIGLILFYGAKGKEKKIPVTDSIDELEKFAEKEAGMKIDIEPKPNASYDPLKDSAGLWKDYDIAADHLREEAWRRGK
ncbi:MAG: hypothetical protein AAF573_16615 [Bacteroidota bacterium]